MIDLTAARQREEEAKGEIARWKADLYAAEREVDALRAENDRLTLAASESARTLQVEIERLKADAEDARRDTPGFQRSTDVARDALSRLCNGTWRGGKNIDAAGRSVFSIPVDRERDADCIISDVITERDALKTQVTALREIVIRTGAWAHQGCGCEWGSRGERTASPACAVDRLLAAIPQDGA